MRESTLWFWHIIAGGVILIFLGLHMKIMHLDAILAMLGFTHGDPIAADVVFQRSRHAFFMISYIILLGAALFHGLYGLRNILFELTLAKGVEKLINWLFLLGGLALFAYGTYAAIYIFLN